MSQSKYSEEQADNDAPYTVTPARTRDQQGHREALATCPRPSETRMGRSQTITRGRRKTHIHIADLQPAPRPVRRPQLSAPRDGRPPAGSLHPHPTWMETLWGRRARLGQEATEMQASCLTGQQTPPPSLSPLCSYPDPATTSREPLPPALPTPSPPSPLPTPILTQVPPLGTPDLQPSLPPSYSHPDPGTTSMEP